MSSAPIHLTSLNAMGRLIFDYVHLLNALCHLGFTSFSTIFQSNQGDGKVNTKGRGGGSVMLDRIG